MEREKTFNEILEEAHIMISYSWDYKKDQIDRFYAWCKENSELKFWKDDQDGINDDLNEDMAFGIENSRLVLVFISEPYFTSKNCRKEFNYADVLDKDIIIVKLQKELELRGRGSISLIASSKLYIDYQEDEEKYFVNILNAIKRKLNTIRIHDQPNLTQSLLNIHQPSLSASAPQFSARRFSTISQVQYSSTSSESTCTSSTSDYTTTDESTVCETSSSSEDTESEETETEWDTDYDNFDETVGPEIVGRLNKNELTAKEVLQKRRQTQFKRRLTM